MPSLMRQLMSVFGSILICSVAAGAEVPTSSHTENTSKRETLLKWALAAPPESFHLIMYVAENSTQTPLPLERMFRDFSERSIDVVWINSICFNKYLAQGLLQYARAHDVRLVLHDFLDWSLVKENTADKLVIDEVEMRKRAAGLRDMLNKQKDGDMVVAYAIGDEIEWTAKGVKNKAKIFQTYAKIVREVDPNRLVNCNHSLRDEDNAGRLYLYNTGEDWPWCSINPVLGGKAILPTLKKLAADNGWSNICGIGQTTPDYRQVRNIDLAWYGFPEDVGKEDYCDVSFSDRIKSSILNSYHAGLAGYGFFLYNGGTGKKGEDDYEANEMVDDFGKDKLGKWSAFLEAAVEVRRLQGWPEITHVSQTGNKLFVSGTGKWGGHAVRWIELQQSGDQGKTWKPLPKIQGRSGILALPAKLTGPVRIRAWDGHHYSMWKFWDVFTN